MAPNRLDRAKQMLSKMIDNMVDDKVGLIVFAGDAFTQLPITCDYVSAKMFLHTITPNLIPTQGTAIGAALQTAITSFGAQDSDAGHGMPSRRHAAYQKVSSHSQTLDPGCLRSKLSQH